MERTEFVETTIDDVTYSDIVPRGYRMDNDTEDLFYGDELEDGMVVLVDGCLPDHTAGDLIPNAILTKNRWCTVTRVRATNSEVVFIGVYSNGDKIRRVALIIDTWIVKLSSVPKDEENEPIESQTPDFSQFNASVKKMVETLKRNPLGRDAQKLLDETVEPQG